MPISRVQGPLTRALIDSATRTNQDHLDLLDELNLALQQNQKDIAALKKQSTAAAAATASAATASSSSGIGNNATATPVQFGGDISAATADSQVVQGLAGVPLDVPSMGAPAPGNVPTYDVRTQSWKAKAPTGGGPSFADEELPTGAIDNANTAFALVYAPNPAASLQLFLNGLLLRQGIGFDYALSGLSLTLAVAPATADVLLAWYRYTGTGTTFVNFADEETPAGSLSDPHIFTLANAPNPSGSLLLFRNGALQREGVGLDYTLAALTVTLVTPLGVGDVLLAWYRFSGASTTIPSFADEEVPAGAINGSNVNFTLTQSPNPTSSPLLFLNGQLLLQGVSFDYTLTGSAIVMSDGPASGDILVAFYRYTGVSTTLPNFADEETPSGVIDGANVTFTLVQIPNPASGLLLFLNGELLQQGVSFDYTLSGTTLTMATAPATGDILLAYYRF